MTALTKALLIAALFLCGTPALVLAAAIALHDWTENKARGGL